MVLLLDEETLACKPFYHFLGIIIGQKTSLSGLILIAFDLNLGIKNLKHTQISNTMKFLRLIDEKVCDRTRSGPSLEEVQFFFNIVSSMNILMYIFMSK